MSDLRKPQIVGTSSNLNAPGLYRAYLDFIRVEMRKERTATNRRMFSVFFWCFFLPAGVSTALLLLVKFGLLPFFLRFYIDWIALLFPVAYSLYFLGAEVLRGLPAAFRNGGASMILEQARREGEWRERIGDELHKTVPATAEEWNWILASFRADLKALKYRARYLTALAGAVFYLLMQGLDFLRDEPVQPLVATGQEAAMWLQNPVRAWMESQTGDLTQFVGLALFLVLLYLSSSQNLYSLERYLDAAELMREKRKAERA